MAAQKLPMMVRSFSTANIASQMVKPPVQLFGIDGRYATALYSAASKQKSLDGVEKDLVNFHTSMKTDAKLRDYLLNPTIKRSLKATALKEVAKQISLKPETTNLFQILSENGRLKNLNGIINAFKTIMAAHRGEVTCEVITAKELEADQKQKLMQVLKTFVKSNESIHLNTKVDPAILGGMIVSIADRYVDMSVAKKIKKYTELISTTV